MLTKEKEYVVVATALQYADKITPLTKEDILLLTKEMVSLIPHPRQLQISFKGGDPTKSWLDSLLERQPKIILKLMRTIEDKPVIAGALEHVCEHISKVKEAFQRYNIHSPKKKF